jgi:single-strand DNA-binding protein
MTLNKVMIIGNMTRDPEMRTTPQGTVVTTFSVATNLKWTDANGQKQEKAEFHNIVAWRKLAETCAQYLKRGSKVYIEGRLQTREWDAQDGTKKQRTEIIAENMIMLDRAGAQFSGSPVGGVVSSNPSTPIASAAQGEEMKVIQVEDADIKIENIPF